MTDEARIQRLTELARLVWTDADLSVGAQRVCIDTASEWGNAVDIQHPRALDALEAALLVLSGEGKTITLESFREAVQEAAEQLAASRAKTSAELAEMLADEARIPLTPDQVTRDALESCRRDREALTKRIREEREAMEQLAKRWDDEALSLAHYAPYDQYRAGECDATSMCARELRERARKP